MDSEKDESLQDVGKDNPIEDEEKEESDATIKLPSSCPVCKRPFNNVMMHIDKKKHCRQSIQPELLKKLQDIREKHNKLKNKIKAEKFRKLHPQKSKEQNKKSKQRQREFNQSINTKYKKYKNTNTKINVQWSLSRAK